MMHISERMFAVANEMRGVKHKEHKCTRGALYFVECSNDRESENQKIPVCDVCGDFIESKESKIL